MKNIIPEIDVHLQSIINSSTEPIYVCVGDDLKVMYANQATLRVWQKDSSIIGKPFIEALPEIIDQPFPHLIRNVYNTGIPYFGEEDRADLPSDGILKTYYFKFSYQPLKDAVGKILGVVCHATDVTDLVITREQVALSQQNLNKMIIQSPVAMCILRGPDYTIEIANKKMFELWGLGDEFTNQSIFVGLPTVKDQFKPLLDEVYLKGKTLELEEVFTELNRDGQPEGVYINFSYQPVREADGSISGVLVVAIDVTSQVLSRMKVQEAEEETHKLNDRLNIINNELASANKELLNVYAKVQESEERFKLAVDNSEVGVFDTNLTTEKTFRSNKHAQIYGYTDNLEEWSLDKLRSHMLPEDYEEANAAYRSSFDSGELNHDFRIIRKDGVLRWINTQGKVVYNDLREPVRIIGTITDITDKIQLEKQKDEFISTVSHELKTPVTSIKAYAQVLKRSLKAENDLKILNFLDRMHIQIDRLENLITDLLDTTRIDTGKLALKKSDIQMNLLLEELIGDLQLIISSHELVIVENTEVTVLADKQRLIQVITNFVTNAVKYSEKSTQVFISLTVAGSKMILSVKDFGKGIPELYRNDVFKRFHQVNRSDMNLGLGLGLYISKEIIARQGGDIWFESEVNAGSTFYFSLPLGDDKG